jgi:hypothetical protein
MDELLRSNNPVLLSVIERLLKGAGIRHMLLDQHMSVMEGSLGILPRRLLVDADQIGRARALLIEAGLADELPAEKP